MAPIRIQLHRSFPWRAKAPLLHPLFFAAYPILALLASNAQEVALAQAVRPLLSALAICLLALTVFWLGLRDWRRSGVATTAFLLVFFSYGHLYSALERLPVEGLTIGRHRYLLPLVILLLVGFLAVLRIRRPDVHRTTQVLNAVGAFLVALPLAMLAIQGIRNPAQGEGLSPKPSFRLEAPSSQPLPDIYYIILDSYARSDHMEDLFGYDNSDFIEFLQSQGFYVASASNSNHNTTGLSLASSLNMLYVQDLGLPLLPRTYPGVVAPVIRNSGVRQALESIGYQTVAMRSGWEPTEILDAGSYLAPSAVEVAALRGPIALNRLESQLARTSIALAALDLFGSSGENWVGQLEDFPHDELRMIILSAFENLPAPASDPAPQFVFAHIISPHPPYLFDASGNPIDQQSAFSLANPRLSGAEPDEAYRDQAIFVTHRTEQAIAEILRRSTTPPIIVLQADHGYRGSRVDWDTVPGRGIPYRTAILNAYLLPDRCRSRLYPDITPVNSFRVVFNCLFGTSLPILPDRVYYTLDARENPNNFLDVTDQVTAPAIDP